MADPRLTVVEAGGPAEEDLGPAFYFDFAAPDAYLVAERILSLMPVPCEWKPVLAGRLPDGLPTPDREHVERTAAERGLQPTRWPGEFDSELAMRAAAFARGGGKTVSFSLAAFRQAYAGGRPLDEDTVLLAGAACEIHPRALLKGVELRSTRQELDRLTEEASARGARTVPAFWTGETMLHGDAELERAIALISG
ncbi:MAG: DsbA family protein [Solirubrobacteraceae bacterium]|nr:DsbA family protein [Solirubrobacteraceae bacterium]